jgi:predicted neuraminidase
MSSNDNCLTWKILGSVISNPKNLQPAVIQRTNGELLTYIRTGGKGGRCWQSTSPDNGRSWTAADPGPFKNPNSALAMIKLKNGHLVAVYNDSDSHRYRTPLVISLSEDEGRTWPIKRTLEDQAGEFTYRTDRIDNWNSIEFSYPAIVQTEDANIHILYTSDSRHTIKHVIVNEVWLNEMKL